MVTRNDWLADIKAAMDVGDVAEGDKWRAASDWAAGQMGSDPGPEPDGEQAVPADSFVERMGINTHLTWRSTVWGNPAWIPLFNELGIRYQMTKLGTMKAAWDDLRACNSIACNHVEERTDSDAYDLVKGQAAVDYASGYPELILGMEGPNECNNGHPPNWDTMLKDYMAWLYEACKAKPTLADKPVFGPSIWKRLVEDYELLGDMSAMMDIGNLHYYTGGNKPTVTSAGDDSGQPQTLEAAIADVGIIAPGKPVWIGETGWPVNGPSIPLSAGTVTPKAQSKYLLRMLCEAINHGADKSFIYTLIDDAHRNPPRYHGILKADLTKRPAFSALKRCLAIYNDPGEAFEPGILAYTLAGEEEVSHLPLMQKRDGTFILTMWQDVASYDQKTFKDIDPPPVAVTIDVGSSASWRVRTPTINNEVREFSGVGALAVDVPDHLAVVEIMM